VIIVDSSVWIDYFNGRATRQTDALHDWLGKRTVVIGDLILAEVLQGFRSDRHLRRARRLMQVFPTVTMLGTTLAVRSAETYRAPGNAPSR
jgi:predicted nucleic acid-binding protein